ncbi:MarR family winged helix-turn-helix transcriptional regulator [Wenyingzhuangia sp. IMCC45574]
MDKSTFNPKHQEKDIASKVVASLERISEVFKVLLWEKAKKESLSPIQIQILIFVAYHTPSLCNVSHLAKEFNITKPTVSDAIRVLDKKELIVKDFSSTDSRSYTILISEKGKEVIKTTYNFDLPLIKQVKTLSTKEQEDLFSTLSKLIYQLNQKEILSVQRTCYGCKFYQNSTNKHYCNLLEKELKVGQIRIDCPEFEEK